jgi:hypothetical protein
MNRRDMGSSPGGYLETEGLLMNPHSAPRCLPLQAEYPNLVRNFLTRPRIL